MSGEDKNRLGKQQAKAMLSLALTERLDTDSENNDLDLQGFDLLGVLGRGGMGTVYKAYHHELDEIVALKVFEGKGSDQDLFIERLKREGRLMLQLEHPNVLGIYDGDVFMDGTPYLVLEFVDGEDLQKRIYDKGRINLKEAIRIAVKVCNGLSAVHALGVIHRDIKPANVLLGSGGTVKVTDFGVSKEVSGVQNTSLTMTGTTIGTVDYMSPEQANGGVVDELSDIFSIGVLLYEMISGVTPRGAFEPLEKYGAPKALNLLVMRCLQRDPARRPVSAESLALQLKKVYKQLRNRNVRDIRSPFYAIFAGLAALSVLAMFVAREVRGHRKLYSKSTPQKAVSGKGGWVDLVKVLDIEKSVKSGIWRKSEGTIVCDRGGDSIIELDEVLSNDYIIDFSFTKIAGKGDIMITLPTKSGDYPVHFSEKQLKIPELEAEEKEEVQSEGYQLELGISYQVEIEVSAGSIVVKWDGKLVGAWEITQELASKSEAKERRLILGADDVQAIFKKLRLIEK